VRQVSVRTDKQRKRSNRIVAVGCYVLIMFMGWAMFDLMGAHGYDLRGLKPTVTTASTALDVTSLPPCPGEAGPIDRTPRLACTWDAYTQGSAGPNLYAARWLVYLPTCPVPFDTVQNRALVQCIEMSDWGE